MLGAITGDVIGSVYEFNNTKKYDFNLFSYKSSFTDDSIMTVAVAEWLIKDKTHSYQTLEDIMLKYGNKYPEPVGAYGSGFYIWLFHPENSFDFIDYDGCGLPYESKTGRHPYNSIGNGAGMRVSPVGWFFDTLEETKRVAEISAKITHNHPKGIKGAQVVASAIWMARKTHSKERIKDYIETEYNYDLSDTWKNLNKTYTWRSDCEGTIAPAIICFLESSNYIDAIRKAVSIGGDSDTLACITGGIAEAYYGGVPNYAAKQVIQSLPKEFINTLEQMEAESYYNIRITR